MENGATGFYHPLFSIFHPRFLSIRVIRVIRGQNSATPDPKTDRRRATADYADIADQSHLISDQSVFYPCHPRNPRLEFSACWISPPFAVKNSWPASARISRSCFPTGASR